jgi:hypothetical protein
VGLLFFCEAKSSGSLAMFAAIRRASAVDEVNSDTSHSHTDGNSGCNLDTETPTPQYEHNQNCRNDKSPVSSGLCGDGPSAFLPSLRPSGCTRVKRATL